MAQVKITLDTLDIALAVSEWSQKEHGITITPGSVMVGTKKEMKGHGIAEKEVHSPNIFFEINSEILGK